MQQDKQLKQLDELRKEYASCPRCPALCKSRTQVVFGSGDVHGKVLFIGEAPGFQEDKQGIPFCGMSGKILDELLQSINLSRKEIFITNTILCRPENNRNPAKEEVENCRQRLDALIKIIKPFVIVSIGNFATERIVGKNGIQSMHGKIFPFRMGHQEIKVVPVIHPANYLYSGRNPELFKQMKHDFKIISRIIKEAKEQKNLTNFTLLN